MKKKIGRFWENIELILVVLWVILNASVTLYMVFMSLFG